MTQTSTSIHCTITLFTIGTWTIARLPESASDKLPSRGMVMGEGTVNGVHFQAPLEPDGKWRHWFRVSSALGKSAGVQAGDTVTVEIEPMKTWPRPEVPQDLRQALIKVPAASALWEKITPKAQWEWIRWIRSTKQAETRARRIEVACSKLKSGMRRPCCFNSNACTEPYVSHNWILLEPTQTAPQ
jgi:hypothetical protein